ncbi:MAG: hypothetical protein K0S00_1100 [Xanthobacteraceae bacterium]|jgi:hypothetical protein|nr:hypothetical protein [Xanthobacteraceae bacterium]
MIFRCSRLGIALVIGAAGLLFTPQPVVTDHSLGVAPSAAQAKAGNAGGNGKGGGNGGGKGSGKSDGGNSAGNRGRGGNPGGASAAARNGFNGNPFAAMQMLFPRSVEPRPRPNVARPRTVSRSKAAGAGSGGLSGRGAVVSTGRAAANARSVIAAGLSEGDIRRLSSRGLRVIARASLAQTSFVKFGLPGRLDAATARRWISDVNRSAVADADAFYYTDEGDEGCDGTACARTLIGWRPPSGCGAPPKIGMIDTGIDLGHEALQGQDIEVVTLDPSSSAGPGHGTAIAALLVGKAGSGAAGLLPEAKLVAVNAFSAHEGTDRTDVLRVVAALQELERRDVKVINLSFSGPPNEVLKQAIDHALALGITLVAAAGNGGPGADPGYPAAYPGVLAVTAVDAEMRIYKRATRGGYIALAAPGVGVSTAAAGGGEADRSGTSFAVPFVTAAVARLASMDPHAGSIHMEDLLASAARDLGAPGRDEVFGWGLVQAAGLCGGPADGEGTDIAGRSASETLAVPRE